MHNAKKRLFVSSVKRRWQTVFKEYNLHRHYESHHKDKRDSLQGQMRANKLSNLKNMSHLRDPALTSEAELLPKIVHGTTETFFL